jgi:hypothetical protein
MTASPADRDDFSEPLRIRWSLAKVFGLFLLEGPRAILWPDDPTGRKEWLECDLGLKRSQVSEGLHEFRRVYQVPNSIKHYARPAVLLRTAEWQTGADYAASKESGLLSLSLTVQHFVLEPSQELHLNHQVRRFDEILDLLCLQEKGLCPLPETAASDFKDPQHIVSGGLTVAVLRRTRGQRIEAGWMMPADRIELDQGVLQLWEDLGGLKASSQPTSSFIERFALPPLSYVDLHSTDRELLWSEIRDCPEFDELWEQNHAVG